MPDPMEEAKTVSYVLETRSVYNRIGKSIELIIILERKKTFVSLFLQSFNL